MRQSQQYQNGQMVATTPSSDKQEVISFEQFAKQQQQLLKRKSSPQGMLTTKTESSSHTPVASPLANQTNMLKNMSLRGNSTHLYYPQPHSRLPTNSSTISPSQSNPNIFSSPTKQFQKSLYPNQMNSTSTQQFAQAPFATMQLQQWQQSQQLQQQQQQQQLQQQQQQNSNQQSWRRNTFQLGNSQQLTQKEIVTQQNQQLSQAQFKINPSKKITQNSQAITASTQQPLTHSTSSVMIQSNSAAGLSVSISQPLISLEHSSLLSAQRFVKVGYTCSEGANNQLNFVNGQDFQPYIINGSIDYSRCIFECRVIKANQVKFAYLFSDFLVICNEPYKKNPEKVFELKPNCKITWEYNRTKAPQRLCGFSIKDENENYEYLADELYLLRLKENISQKIFQSRFQDEYEVIQQVGKGNYARVFSVKHRATGQKLAVKCFDKGKLAQIEKGGISLHNELKIMRNLRGHPNVIKLHEVFEGENTFYFVMDIVEGSSLYDSIKKHAQTPYKEQEIRDIVGMLVDGIAYCASKDIMHRDLKPENILFGKQGNQMVLKIVDFGLAAFTDEAPYIFPKCGTPGFVAPEIANLVDKTQGYSSICDMFSIGVIFHILLTGEAVFPGTKFNEVLKLNRACEINLDKPMYDHIPDQTKDLLRQMLEKDPNRRISASLAQQHPYFTMANSNYKRQLSDEFQQYLSHQTPLMRSTMEQDYFSQNNEKQSTAPLFSKSTRVAAVPKQENGATDYSNMTDENQNSIMAPSKSRSGSGDQSSKLFTAFDKNPIVDSQNSNILILQKSKSHQQVNNITKQSKDFNTGIRGHKESIIEEHGEEEDDISRVGNKKKRRSNRYEDRMEEEN